MTTGLVSEEVGGTQTSLIVIPNELGQLDDS